MAPKSQIIDRDGYSSEQHSHWRVSASRHLLACRIRRLFKSLNHLYEVIWRIDWNF
jgi:hypothetical protein